MVLLMSLHELPHDKTNIMTLAPSNDSDQLGHLVSLIRVFAVHSVGSWGPKVSSCGQRRPWSDWVDVQADLSLRWVHRSFCWFCHAAAHIISVIGYCPVILIAVMILNIDTDSSHQADWSESAIFAIPAASFGPTVVVCLGLTSLSTIFQSYHDGVWLRQGAQCSLL